MFTKQEYSKINVAIEQAESITSASIHVHVRNKCKQDALKDARIFFKHARLFDTDDRNSVLIFIAETSRCFAILGDQGAHDKLADNFWDECQVMMSEYFKQGQFVDGINAVIEKISVALAEYFPNKSQHDKSKAIDEITVD